VAETIVEECYHADEETKYMWWGQNCELKPRDLQQQFPQQDCTSGGYYIPMSHINVPSAMHSA